MLEFQRADWMQRAACRGMDTNMFFPERGASHRAANDVCADCPVRQECHDLAETNNERGIWGGVSDRGRRIERKRYRSAA
jgi:WhiB family redox-sensing transcriptional regulator